MVWLSVEIRHGVWTEHDPGKHDTEREIIGMFAEGNNYCIIVRLWLKTLYILI